MKQATYLGVGLRDSVSLLDSDSTMLARLEATTDFTKDIAE